MIYRDGLQSSSGQYDSVNISGAVFSKTPNIDDPLNFKGGHIPWVRSGELKNNVLNKQEMKHFFCPFHKI